jgi:transcriptional regulator with XRE-family HTH domain
VTSDERQAAIAVRFREGREWRDLSQTALAEMLEMTRDQIANIESGRAVLRCDVANRYCSFLGVNQRWLATGAEPDVPFIYLPDQLPCPSGFVPDGTFSQMYDAVLAPYCNAFFEGGLDRIIGQLKMISYARPLGQRGAGMIKEEAPLLWRAIHDLVSQLVLILPPSQYGWLWDRLREASIKFVQANAPAIEEFRKSAQREIDGSRDLAGMIGHWSALGKGAKAEARAPSVSPGGPGFSDTNKELASSDAVPLNPPAMARTLNESWESLRKRLVAATERENAKAELAAALGVNVSAVSQWRHEHTRPDAENTLRILAWVTAEEAGAQRRAAVTPLTAAPKAAKSPKSKPGKAKR